MILKKKLSVLFLFVGLFSVCGKAQFNDSVHHYLGYAAIGILNQTNKGNSLVLNNAVKFNVNKKNKYLNSNAA